MGDAAAQMIAGGASLLLAGAAFGERLPAGPVPGRCVFAWAWLVVFGSLIGFSTYTWLLRHARPTIAMSYAYVNPVVAAFIGVAIGGEHLGWPAAIATVLIVSGVMVAVVRKTPAT
jgi:drug/metabolite transporter (DMT)-like permease